MMPMRVIEVYTGAGGFTQALENLEAQYEVVDVLARDAEEMLWYNRLHNTDFEYTDLKDWDRNHYCPFCKRLFKYQDHPGMWTPGGGGVCANCGADDECFRKLHIQDAVDAVVFNSPYSEDKAEVKSIVEQVILTATPHYVIWVADSFDLEQDLENNYHYYIQTMSKLGYVNSAGTMNPKMFGSVEDHDYTIVVSIHNGRTFEFPKGRPGRWRLRNYLDPKISKQNNWLYMPPKEGDMIIPTEEDLLEMVIQCEPYRSYLSSKLVRGDEIYSIYSKDGLAPAIKKGSYEKTLIAEEDLFGFQSRHFGMLELLEIKGFPLPDNLIIPQNSAFPTVMENTANVAMIQALAERMFRYCITFTKRDCESKQGLVNYLLADTDERLWQAVANFGKKNRLIGNYLLSADTPDGKIGLEDLWEQESDHIYHK